VTPRGALRARRGARKTTIQKRLSERSSMNKTNRNHLNQAAAVLLAHCSDLP
jgi:hypothetical protein